MASNAPHVPFWDIQRKAMQLQLQHSKRGTRPSALSLDQGYLADIVKRLSFPRAYGTAANAKAEVMVADEFLRMFGSCDRVGNTRNVCFGWPAEARILIGAHFDSVPNTPGADDNASAVVGLAIPPGLPLEAIRQISPHLRRSDHAPFWEKNIPAVMWTDT